MMELLVSANNAIIRTLISGKIAIERFEIVGMATLMSYQFFPKKSVLFIRDIAQPLPVLSEDYGGVKTRQVCGRAGITNSRIGRLTSRSSSAPWCSLGLATTGPVVPGLSGTSISSENKQIRTSPRALAHDPCTLEDDEQGRRVLPHQDPLRQRHQSNIKRNMGGQRAGHANRSFVMMGSRVGVKQAALLF